MSVSRRNLVRGAAWTVPAVTIAAAAPAMAASGTSCLDLIHESSGGSYCFFGLWTNSNIASPTYMTTLQTKPLYECACTTLHYCPSDAPASVSNVTITLAIPNCYTIAPQNLWQTDNSGASYTVSRTTATVNGAACNIITLTYDPILQYQAGKQVQIPLDANCNGGDFTGPKIYSRESACSTTPSSWFTITNSGTSFTS